MMDWLFGRKKSEAKVDDAKDGTEVVDGFVMFPPVSERPSYPAFPSLPNYPGYPPPAPSCSAQPSNHVMPSMPAMNHQRPVKQHTNPLDSVPFRLSSQLDSNKAQTVPPELQRIGSFLTEVRRALDSSECNYDFRLERSVLRELTAFNGLQYNNNN